MKNNASHSIKMSREDIYFHVIGYFVFSLLILICAYPFYYLMICTISGNELVDLGKIFLWPKGIHFSNYIKIFKLPNLLHAFGVTTVRTILGTFLSLVLTSYMAYFFTKTEMWGRKFFYRLTVATMYFSAGMIPVYLNNKMLGLVNTFWIYVIPGCISVYNMVLVKTSIESMPPALEESALLDGAGYFCRYLRIVMPLQKPILATVGLFTAVSHWNDFFTTKLYITNTKLYTVQFLLYELLNQVTSAATQIDQFSGIDEMTITPMGIRLTLTAVVIIPIMCVYPFIQKYYVKGIMIGAVKG